MLIYVIKKVMLIIPTVIMVMVLAFFLSKLVPGDGAESLMSLQGVLPQNSNASQVYQKNYVQLNLDKPNFYFSIQPDFYPNNLNEILSPSKRMEIKSFLEKKYECQQILQYLNHRDDYVFALPNILLDSTLSKISKSQIESSRNLLFISSIADISLVLDSLAVLPILATKPSFQALQASFDSLKNAKRKNYLPKVIWHGTNNQFHLWVSGLMVGDWGISIKDGRKVLDKIGPAISWTLLLLLLNLIITVLIAIPTGVISGYKVGGYFDKVSNVFWLGLYSMPVFWLASMLIIYFTSEAYGSWLDIFPPPGSWIVHDDMGFWEQVHLFSAQLVLPVICLVANDIAYLSRLTRNNILFHKWKGFVTMAKAKGLNERKILIRHILPNALIPIVTIIAGNIPAGLSGSLIIEVIFNIPGMGRLMYDSIYSADWNVVFGILIIISFCTIIFLLLADIIYGWLNPKIKLQ